MFFQGITMALTVSSLARPSGEDLFYTAQFRTAIESHLNLLRTTGITEEPIQGDILYQFEGNFYGYLASLGIDLHLNWIYLRVNGMEHPNQFGAELRDPYNRAYSRSLIHPSRDVIDSIRGLYLTTKFKS